MPTAKFSRPITYYTGITQFSAKSAVLSWDTDDVLTLDVVDANNVPIERVFQTPIKGLKVGGNLAVIWFKINGKKVRVDFSISSRMVSAASGLVGGSVANVAGLYAQSELIKSSGVLEWLRAFRENGATVKYWSHKSAVVIGFIFGLIIGAGIIAIFITDVIAESQGNF